MGPNLANASPISLPTASFPWMLPESRTIGFRLSLKYYFFEGVVFFLNRISIRTAVTLSKLLAVVRSEMCTQGLIGWITFFWSSVLTDSYYLGLRTPLDMRMPISSVPFSDCPIENGLSTISCATLMTMISISYLRNETMIWWCLKPWLSVKFCCDGDKRYIEILRQNHTWRYLAWKRQVLTPLRTTSDVAKDSQKDWTRWSCR